MIRSEKSIVAVMSLLFVLAPCFAAADTISREQRDKASRRFDDRIETAVRTRGDAEARCTALEDDLQDLCEAQAKADFIKSGADARADRESDIAYIAADEVKRKADHEVAELRCETMFSGGARKACIARAEVDFSQ